VTPDYQAPFVLPPGATEVILVRHGSSVPFEPGAPSHMLGGQNDPPLSERGQAQAQAVAERLGGEPIAALLISPLRRTAQTGAPLAAVLGLEPEVVPELREVHLGLWEPDGGFSISRPDGDALRQRVLDEEEWGLIPGAEDVRTLGERARRGLEVVALRIGPDAVGVAIAHGGIICELCHQVAASRPFAFFATENGSISRIVRDHRGRWSLRAFNDTGHLR
jgi:probable phosphoglycerate mutase